MNIDNKTNLNSKTVAFLTLGCKVNSYETEAMQKIFEDAGYKVVDFETPSDVYVVNTCTVTNIADRKSRQMLHKARKMNENAVVVAVGCYAQTAGETLKEDEAVDIVIGNNKKKDIIRILNEYYNSLQSDRNGKRDEENSSKVKLSFTNQINSETEYEDLSIESFTEKNRAYIKIQDGCNQFCSYCIIPYARGRVRSRKMDFVINEVENLVSKGYKEIVLTGIHLSSYGIDFDNQGKNHLLELIVTLSHIDGLERIRLGSLEPRIITEEFVKTLSENKKICPHFHLSLQSGCDATLKRMNRKYTSQEYYEKCVLLREYFHNPAITTDVIVGFPGETEEEFQETYNFLKKVSFAQMHIFKYSVRKGTRAERMSGQVKDEIKTARSNQLLELGEELSAKYRSSFIGRIENILIEEDLRVDGETYQVGHNERYIKMAVKSDKNLSNSIVKGKVTGFLNKDVMFCEIMD
ncbi:MAG: tRNA (N(6)-L-threonylcarbamoyladenosine(37)-C(2))-methylthiotransferase MtaB [Lachnoclostridium sp.]|jgi:threonylcarbamoyladenosine tRNA methylthiotransferase MtaB